MRVEGIDSVCFVGAGTMGCFNSLVAAVSGYRVTVHDVGAETLAQVAQRQSEFAAFLVGSGYCTAQAIEDALPRITICNELEQAVAQADLVSESVFERLDLKRSVHAQLDALCPARTILTTNSSALLVSDIESAVQRGERFAALHSHLGAPLVDIVRGPRTSAVIIEQLQRYVLSLGGVPLVLKKEHRGYVFNAMIGPVLTTAMLLVIRGSASIELVDRAWMQRRGAPMGPFGMMDLFGLNVIADSWEHRAQDDGPQDSRSAILSFLAPLLARGNLGMKSGRGFYTYPDPAYARVGFVADGPELDAADRALCAALILSAALLAHKGIAEPADIDRAWKVATRLDTGPFAILGQIGAEVFLSWPEAQFGTLAAADAGNARNFVRAPAA